MPNSSEPAVVTRKARTGRRRAPTAAGPVVPANSAAGTTGPCHGAGTDQSAMGR
ncbi:hypothetical protein PV779_11875 [Streptomyces sp. ID01-9D]|nr:hypothetical protein [Streptomyces sp. ID01-9D]